MADSKITSLSAVTSPTGSEVFPVNESGTSKKATLTQLQTYLGKVIVKTISSDTSTTSSSTLQKLTNLDQTLAAGTYVFEYRIVFQSSNAGCAMMFSVNFSGTQTLFVAEGTQFESTTTATQGTLDQVHGTYGLRSGGSARAPSTTSTIISGWSVDTVDANIQVNIKGTIVVTVSGDLQLYYASSQDSVGSQKVIAGTSLVCRKVA